MDQSKSLIKFLAVALAVAVAVIVILVLVLPYRGSSEGFSSDGQRIYYTLTSENERISFEEGPLWYEANRGGCVVCHAPDARGSEIPMGGGFRAPDIRYRELTRQRGDQPGHTQATIKKAITQGVAADGTDLNNNMPRYQMTDGDVNDVIDFLKTTL
ncbi:MAG: c-type cytochrome [Candidatus Aquicultorales bacterium]